MLLYNRFLLIDVITIFICHIVHKWILDLVVLTCIIYSLLSGSAQLGILYIIGTFIYRIGHI